MHAFHLISVFCPCKPSRLHRDVVLLQSRLLNKYVATVHNHLHRVVDNEQCVQRQNIHSKQRFEPSARAKSGHTEGSRRKAKGGTFQREGNRTINLSAPLPPTLSAIILKRLRDDGRKEESSAVTS